MDGWNVISFATFLQLCFNSIKQPICDFVFIHIIYVNIYANFDNIRLHVNLFI